MVIPRIDLDEFGGWAALSGSGRRLLDIGAPIAGLSREAKYFKMFFPFMWPISKLVTLPGITIDYETFVYQAEIDEWMENLERIGAKAIT
jgi:hypothetical protein